MIRGTRLCIGGCLWITANVMMWLALVIAPELKRTFRAKKHKR